MDKKIVIVGDLTENSREMEYLSHVINHCEEATVIVDTGMGISNSVTTLENLRQRGEIAGMIILGFNMTLAASITPEQLGDYPQLYILNAIPLADININKAMVYCLRDYNPPIDEQDLNQVAFAMAGMVKGNYPGGIERTAVASQQSRFTTTPVM